MDYMSEEKQREKQKAYEKYEKRSLLFTIFR